MKIQLFLCFLNIELQKDTIFYDSLSKLKTDYLDAFLIH